MCYRKKKKPQEVLFILRDGDELSSYESAYTALKFNSQQMNTEKFREKKMSLKVRMVNPWNNYWETPQGRIVVGPGCSIYRENCDLAPN